MAKYPLLREILVEEGLLAASDVLEPGEAAIADLRLVHTDDYLDKFARGTLAAAEVRRLGVPWSPAPIYNFLAISIQY